MSDAGSLRGLDALVTGASRGIGARVAERLAEEGARVWLLARSGDALDAVAARIGATALPADLADDASVWSALDRLQEAVGGPPGLVVNAAGVFGLEPLATETVLDFDRHVEVNLRGAFLVIRSLLPAMLERGDGLIVNVGSVAGRRAFPGNGAYSASKYGLRGMHEVLLEEVRGTGVRATLLEPAATDTSAWDRHDPDSAPDLPNRSAMLDVDDVAEAVVFVASRPPHVRIPLLQIERA
ncbi:MAG: SDR family oxidoreductase [Gemmatimonadetes bacterium]|nr:SDR family oxidoreductase [Gemmatimonadota bacterium]